MKRYPLRWMLLIVILANVCTGCSLFPEEEIFPAAPILPPYEMESYEQATVMRGDLFVTKTVRCKYAPVKYEDLSFDREGEYIEKVYVTKGQFVKAGEVLAELVQDDLKARIESQSYQIQVIKRKIEHLKADWRLDAANYDDKLRQILEELETVRQLIVRLSLWQQQGGEEQSLPDQTRYVTEKPTEMTLEELRDLEAKLITQRDSRRAKVKMNEKYDQQLQELEDSLYIENLYLEELKQELSARQIVAGIDGTVTYVSEVKAGQRSKKGERFITVSDMSTTAFTVEGADAAYFPVGEKTTITKGSNEYAAVSVEAAVLDMEERGPEEKPVAYLMLEQPDPTLKGGATGSIKLVQESSLNTLYVNKEAVKTANGKQFVYILNEAGLKVMRDVTVGITSGGYIEIVHGLEEGDSVIVQ